MKRMGLVIGCVAVVLVGSGIVGLALAAGSEANQKTCPISGEAINANSYADFDGKRVYFCCDGCAETFKADASKRIQQMEAEGVVFASAGTPQTHCPIMGGKIDKTVFADHDGKRVYFCCPGCIPKFNEDAGAHIKKMESQGLQLDPTPNPQTHCPIMGGEIDKTVFADHGGKRVYFCCPGCIPKFNEDPGAHIRKLEEKGFTLAGAECDEDHDHGQHEGHDHGQHDGHGHDQDKGHDHSGGHNH